MKNKVIRKKFKIVNKILKKSVPLYLAIIVAFNTTLGVALIQHFIYKKDVNKLISYKEQLDKELANTPEKKAERLQTVVLPKEGVNTGIRWEDLGKRLVETGVIDEEKFLSLFKFPDEKAEYKNILSKNSPEYIILTEGNSRFVLNTLWALGLAQKSKVLDDMRSEYPQVENLAATGGWSIGKKSPMQYYSQSDLLDLTKEQQIQVASIAQNIYRPCCNNHTAFADCNHGMAMLGLIELMVANGYSETKIYETALKVNSYWFPDTYLTLANYFESQENTQWKDIDAKLVLGRDFSSGSGYQNILAQVQPLSGSRNQGGCGV